MGKKKPAPPRTHAYTARELIVALGDLPPGARVKFVYGAEVLPVMFVEETPAPDGQVLLKHLDPRMS